MNILIIGGGGFLGQELSRYLGKQDFTISCTSHMQNSSNNFSLINIDMGMV